jgi:hypothetical protein
MEDDMRKLFVLLILTMPAVLAMAATPALCKTEAPPALTTAQQKVTAEFNRLDEGIRQAARTLGTTGLAGDQARSALMKLCNDFDYAADCAAIDLQGKMVTIEPAPYRQFEGKDISAQAQVKRIMKTGKPVLSSVFRSVEGFPAADVEYPVSTPNGQKLGFVSILFHPEKLLSKIIVPLVQGTPVDIWVMEKRGLILYDTDALQIGLILFSSALYRPYSGLIQLGRRIAAMPEGNGVYKFRSASSSTIVKKNAFWQSVSLYGADWRLVAIHAEQKGPVRKTGILVPASTLEQKLESFAATNSLINVLSAGDKTKGMQLFKDFYDDAPGIYSVQWMDEKGVNRFGYPRENSFTDYNYNTRRTAADQDFLGILAERKSTVSEKQLFEGRKGIFTFRPVFKQDRYLGMVYYIRLQ